MSELSGKDLIHSIEKVPKPKYFFGRKGEIEEVSDFMTSSSYKVLTIRGIAGVGKTALLSKVVGSYKDEKNILYITIYSRTTLRGFLVKLADFLSELGRDQLEDYLSESSGSVNLEEVNLILEEDLQDSNLLFIIDDVHNASEEIITFFRSFKDILPATDAKVVIMGRAIPLFYDQRDVVLRERIKELNLGGLDKDSSRELLNQREIDESYHDKLYSITRGHPLMLELISPESATEAMDFIDTEVIAPLSEEGKKAMKIASMFRGPFSPDLLIDQGISDQTIDTLLEKSLLRRVNEDYRVHEMLRDIFYARMSSEEKVKYHKLAAEYHVKSEDPAEIVETIHHLIKAYEQSEAARIAISNREKLLAPDYLRQVLRELDHLDEEETLEYWPGVLFLRGEIYRRMGEFDYALDEFRNALEYIESVLPSGRERISYLWFGLPEGVRKMKAEIQFKTAQIYEEKGDIDRAKDYYEDSLKTYEALEDVEEPKKVREALENLKS